MDAASYYRDADVRPCQGDVFEYAPHLLKVMLMQFFLFLTRVRLDEAVFDAGPQAGEAAE